jgi:hypothetical protein
VASDEWRARYKSRSSAVLRVKTFRGSAS